MFYRITVFSFIALFSGCLSAPEADVVDLNSLADQIAFADKIQYDISPDSAVVRYQQILFFAKKQNKVKEQIFLHNRIAENYFVFNLSQTKKHLDSALILGAANSIPYPENATTFDNYGIYFEHINQFDSGLHYITRGLNFRLLRSYLSLAYHYGKTRREFDKAFAYIDQALAIRTRVFGENSIKAADCYNNLAYYHSVNQDYRKALLYQKKVVKIIEEKDPQNKFALMNSYNSVGKYHLDLGEEKSAITWLNKSVLSNKAESNQLLLADAFMYLGQCHQFKNPEKAKSYYDSAYSVYSKIIKPNTAPIAYLSSKIGDFLASSGNYDSAMYHLRKAERIHKERLKEDPVRYALASISLSDLHYKMKDWQQAMIKANQAIEVLSLRTESINQEIKDAKNGFGALSSDLYAAYYLKGKALIQMNKNDDLKTALSSFNQAIDNIELLKKSYTSDQARELLMENTSRVFDLAIQAASELYFRTADNNYKELAFRIAEKNRAFNLLNETRNSKARTFANIPDKLLLKEEQLKRDLTFYRQRAFSASGDSAEFSKLRERIFSLESEYDEFNRRLELEYPKYYQLKYQSVNVSLKDISTRLKNDEALIEYYTTKNYLFTFVITSNNSKLYRIIKPVAFEAAVQKFYIAINKYDKESFEHFADLLHESLYMPLIKSITPQITKIRIVPHNEISYISFDCLKPFKSDQFLIEKYEISYHYSATLSFSTDDSPSQIQNIALFAPVFDNNSSPEFPPLTSSKSEVENISKLFQAKGLNAKISLRSTATKRSFQDQLQNYDLIHLATHTAINRSSVDQSAIYFAPDTDDTDHVMTLAETYNIELDASLLTLSSCESGIGKIVKGEGMLSFTRGFSYSGVDNITCSMWKVNDLYTSQTMLSYYEGILEGKTFASALREAKLKLLKSDSTLSPKEWAGFILINN